VKNDTGKKDAGKTVVGRGAETRAAAAFAVDQVLAGGHSLDRALKIALSDRLAERDQALVKALAFGALRWHQRHRLIIGTLLDRPLRSRDRILEALLSVGLFQLIDTRQPGYASVSATVDATKKLHRPRAAGLVNATLRRFQREQNTVLPKVLARDEGRYSHPQWLIDQLRVDWGDQAQQILTFALARPPMWLRVNTARNDAAATVDTLQSTHGIDAVTLAGFPAAVCLAQPMSVSDLPGFADGLVSVQDAAAQLAAELLDATPGMRVLDACAAPGGKTGHILERAGGQLDVVAIDVDAARNEMVAQNLERLGYNAQIMTADVQATGAWAGDISGDATFDRILVDAPCSATGVIRRHPDIKFLRRPEDIPVLAARQGNILDALWPLLKPGGQLLYATCSVLRAENHEVATEFLRRHPDATEVRSPDIVVPEAVAAVPGPGYQLLPGPANTDGFYYALMERSA
jgi:16S rRNA (cytosine967-C5)-methyltransferase